MSRPYSAISVTVARPSDGEILALWAGGMKRPAIASYLGLSVNSVQHACERARGFGTKTANPDMSFTHFGSAPIAHRDTKAADTGLHVTDAYTVEPLEREDVSDLLREWGAAC